MDLQQLIWDASSARSWAALMGLVHVPMFGPSARPRFGGEHAVLLDGPRGSFAFSATDDRMLIAGDDALSWAWSAHVRHALLVDSPHNRVYLRRWDAPGVMRLFSTPECGSDAADLFHLIERSPAPRTPDVIQHVLQFFRLLRQALRAGRDSALWAVRVMNALLLLTARVREGKLDEKQLRECRTFADALAKLPERQRMIAEVAERPGQVDNQDLGVLMDVLLAREPLSGCVLHPDLLLRHASSNLYQEAHLEIERNPQLSFAGLGRADTPTGEAPRDVRFTPANLARALVQKALASVDPLPSHLVVTDPACGSGVFLRECVRELSQRQFGGAVHAIGHDISKISESMTRFCLAQVREDLGRSAMRLRVSVASGDSLARDWGTPDLVLMNPPFGSFESVPDERRAAAASVLGDLARGRFDYAMPFVVKAARSLKPGGVLACVLPAPVLSNRASSALRECLEALGSVLLLGRFEGYRYFPTSIVETAFMVFRRTKAGAGPASADVTVVVGEEGSEDAALRSLRMPPSQPISPSEGIDRYQLPRNQLSAVSWRPVRQRVQELREILRALGLPPVDKLFAVRQGTRLGVKKALTLGAQEYRSLPAEEKGFFRPTAGQGTILGGRLEKCVYVFFPYNADGLQVEDEEDLRTSVPRFYRQKLLPNVAQLKGRLSLRGRKWWEPSEPRRWQFVRSPQIVSTYFGESGSFAYDAQGSYLVVNGHAWVWRGNCRASDVGLREFHASRLPWVYLAMLNSPLFERIMTCFSTQLQGGQMRLEARFLGKVPIPDMGASAVDPVLLQRLADLGRGIHRCGLEGVRGALDEPTAAAYGLPSERFDLR